MSQVAPSYPAAHSHVKVARPSVQTPPLRHGGGEQSSGSARNKSDLE